jgi:hypothetical protein
MEEPIQSIEGAQRQRKKRRSPRPEPLIEIVAEEIQVDLAEPKPEPGPTAPTRTQPIRPMPRRAPVPRRGVKSATNVQR